MTRRVTMDDVAARAGVSKYAVSKALSGQSGVSEQTRERILGVATDLGYVQQRRLHGRYERSGSAAIGLAGRDKRSVMVLMPNIRLQSLDSHYWGRIVDGIAQALNARNLFMIIATEYSHEGWSSIFNAEELIGVIVVGTISGPMLQEVSTMALPVVMVDHEDERFVCDMVFADNVDGAGRMASHLLGVGHERLQFVGDVHFSRSFHERWLGVRLVLESRGVAWRQDQRLLGVYSPVWETTRDELVKIFNDLRSEGGMPTAFLCANDDLALATVSALTQLGLRVPEDVSVTGFDNIEDAEVCNPPLTTMNVVKEELGERAVEMVLRRRDNPSTMFEKVFLFTELIQRGSVASPLSVGTV